MTAWRVGAHYGIHVYEGDRPVATFHTVADARQAVRDHNAAEAPDSECYTLPNGECVAPNCKLHSQRREPTLRDICLHCGQPIHWEPSLTTGSGGWIHDVHRVGATAHIAAPSTQPADRPRSRDYELNSLVESYLHAASGGRPPPDNLLRKYMVDPEFHYLVQAAARNDLDLRAKLKATESRLDAELRKADELGLDGS